MIFKKIKLLTDENISPVVVNFLRLQNIDVLDVKENNWIGKTDEELIKTAYLGNRFVLTHDEDFGKSDIFEGISYYGIIYIKLKNIQATNVIKVYSQLLNLKTDILSNSLVIIEDTKLRIRNNYQ